MTGASARQPAPSRQPRRPGEHLAVAYLRARPAADPPLDLPIQRAAIEALAATEGYRVERWVTEPEPVAEPLTVFAGMTDDIPPSATVIIATADVLGDRAVERAARLLALLASGIGIRLTDATTPESAVRAAWSRRPAEERRRERAREGMRRRALRAEVLGRPPFGYAAEGRSLVPHPREAQTVQRIFDLYLDADEGVRRIARLLNEADVRTRLGKPWSAGAVRTVLRNSAYLGVYRRLGVAVTGAHPALVTRARFDEVQRRMSTRRTSPTAQRRHAYLLAGLVRCGHCGGRMVGARRAPETQGGRAVAYYRCGAATNQGRCATRSIRAETLEIAVVEQLARDDLAEGDPPEPVRRERGREPLERAIARALERWSSGEWTFRDLVRVAGDDARAWVAEDIAAPAPSLDPAAASVRLVSAWTHLDDEERRHLLLAAVAEVVVRNGRAKVMRRRPA